VAGFDDTVAKEKLVIATKVGSVRGNRVGGSAFFQRDVAEVALRLTLKRRGRSRGTTACWHELPKSR